MDTARKLIDKKILKDLEPLRDLSIDKLDELAKKSVMEELPAGRLLFRQGERDTRLIYVLSGQVELLTSGNANTDLVKAKTLEAKYPLAHQLPRPCSAKTKTAAVMLYVDGDLLDLLLDDNPSGEYEVTEINLTETDDENGWLLRFLQSRAFLQLPTENIQALLVRMEEITVKRGQAIIKQDERDDFYYIVKKGSCAVSRRPAPSAEDVRLAVLSDGDGFGEEALITNNRRNATVTMLENGVLMRLHKDDFINLLIAPVIQYVEHKDLRDTAKTGAQLIDVRKHKEFSNNGLDGALNIPQSMVRLKLKSMNPSQRYLLYCNDGSQSAAAAFLMIQHGLNCRVLKGGLSAVAQQLTDQANGNNIIDFKSGKKIASETSSTSPLSPTEVKKDKQTPKQNLAEQSKRVEQTTHAAEIAEKTKRVTEGKAKQLQREAEQLRQQSDNLAIKTARVEAARQQAATNVENLEASDKVTSKPTQQQESTNRQRAEFETMRNQAKAAMQQAEAELEKIRREAELASKRREELEAARKRAEQMEREATAAAESAKQKARLESAKLRSEAEQVLAQAQQEAARLRESINSQVVARDEERNRIQEDLAQAQVEAKKALEQSQQTAERLRQKAKADAEAIRQEAHQDAQKLRDELETIRRQLLETQEQAQTRQAEQLKSEHEQALQEAHRLAEMEASAIREQVAAETRKKQEELLRLERVRAREEATTLKQRAEDEAKRQEELLRQERERLLQEEAHKREIGDAPVMKNSGLITEAFPTEIIHTDVSFEIPGEIILDDNPLNKASQAKTSKIEPTQSTILKKTKDHTILSSKDDLFIFKTPKGYESGQGQQTSPGDKALASTEQPAGMEVIPELKPSGHTTEKVGASSSTARLQTDSRRDDGWDSLPNFKPATFEYERAPRNWPRGLVTTTLLLLVVGGSYVFYSSYFNDPSLTRIIGLVTPKPEITTRLPVTPPPKAPQAADRNTNKSAHDTAPSLAEKENLVRKRAEEEFQRLFKRWQQS